MGRSGFRRKITAKDPWTWSWKGVGTNPFTNVAPLPPLATEIPRKMIIMATWSCSSYCSNNAAERGWNPTVSDSNLLSEIPEMNTFFDSTNTHFAIVGESQFYEVLKGVELQFSFGLKEGSTFCNAKDKFEITAEEFLAL